METVQSTDFLLTPLKNCKLLFLYYHLHVLWQIICFLPTKKFLGTHNFLLLPLLPLLSFLSSFSPPTTLLFKATSTFYILKSCLYKSLSCLLLWWWRLTLLDSLETLDVYYIPGSVLTTEDPKINDPISVLESFQSKWSDVICMCTCMQIVIWQQKTMQQVQDGSIINFN